MIVHRRIHSLDISTLHYLHYITIYLFSTYKIYITCIACFERRKTTIFCLKMRCWWDVFEHLITNRWHQFSVFCLFIHFFFVAVISHKSVSQIITCHKHLNRGKEACVFHLLHAWIKHIIRLWLRLGLTLLNEFSPT